MRRSQTEVLSAVTISLVAAFGLVGCGSDRPTPPPSLRTTIDMPSRSAAPAAAPLPSPDALTDVLYRLADSSIPAEQKIGLVQYATVDDQAALANFGDALKANGFDPLSVQATDVTWAGTPGQVTATVTVGSTDGKVKPFTYPMEFSPLRETWQLSRQTADQLLPFVGATQPTR